MRPGPDDRRAASSAGRTNPCGVPDRGGGWCRGRPGCRPRGRRPERRFPDAAQGPCRHRHSRPRKPVMDVRSTYACFLTIKAFEGAMRCEFGSACHAGVRGLAHRPLSAARRWQAGSRRRTAVLEVSPFQSTMERLLGQLSNRVLPCLKRARIVFPPRGDVKVRWPHFVPAMSSVAAGRRSETRGALAINAAPEPGSTRCGPRTASARRP